jgi:lysozyme
MTGTNLIVDLSHHNGAPDLQKAKAAGIVGVIQKATQGTSFTDPTFAANRKKAADVGLLFGAYHFGVGADGVEQADFFLSTVQPGGSDIVVLDFEANPQGPSMNLEEARAFVTHVHGVKTVGLDSTPAII